MPAAEIIAIGTELLLGEIQDTNTRYLARFFRDIGVDLYRATVIGDNASRVAQVIREATQRAQIVITTGGLGPTIDDPAREAVALAMQTELYFSPELWQQIQARFQRYGRQATDNNRRQAYIPTGSIAIENPVGTAPAFIFETVDFSIISLPGVPREMEYLLQNSVLPYLKDHFQLKGLIKARVLHTAGVGESQVDEWIGDLETWTNPTVGLLAHAGQVDVRITAKAETVEEADRMIADLSTTIYQRLGFSIYGEDSETLEEVALRKVDLNGYSLGVIECGLEGELKKRLDTQNTAKRSYEVYAPPCEMDALRAKVEQHSQQYDATAILGVSLIAGQEKQTAHFILKTPQKVLEDTRFYGGSPYHAQLWANNLALDFLRRNV